MVSRLPLLDMVACPIFSPAVHPQYSDFIDRIHTFKYWPIEHLQKSRILAEAGFFASGVSDLVICFQCDAGFRSWLAEDDPWELHYEYCKDICLFLLNNYR